MRSAYIRKLDPSKTRTLEMEYDRFKANCFEYEKLSKEEFLKCNNSIYIIEDRLINEYMGNFYGIIGSRLITLEESKIDKLDFYCKPYNTDHSLDLLYEIKFLHFDQFKGFSINENKPFLSALIKYCIADKNDGFTLYRAKCDNIVEDFEDVLIENNFKFCKQEYNAIKEKYYNVYLRPPVMLK